MKKIKTKQIEGINNLNYLSTNGGTVSGDVDVVGSLSGGTVYIDEYIDLVPQSTIPTPKKGRIFFSGGTTNRLFYNSGGTSNDWIMV